MVRATEFEPAKSRELSPIRHEFLESTQSRTIAVRGEIV